ncbi:TonB-dependent receptor [Myxococcus sp. SDU36]|uniref:TonB-dependent receptor plug domain-containing protein n=1 Tax=Myxococcus sp. SDU36 TaxID=2831967 RepID=UPI002543AAB0|nr:TonB-dependent receptor [Myxococcus sp. SDU36]WIG95291.1 TonB-dependent receptor [Myxococcus sp. SDU36]
MAWRGCLLFVACAMPWTAWGGGSEAPAAEVASTAEAPPDARVAQADAGPQPASDEEALPEARTVVTASRSPERLEDSAVATEVITRSDILASGARDASELLAAHPGLQVVQTFAGATVQLQGLSPEYVLVLVDGERVAGRVAGSVDLSRLSTEDIEQVEVVKGPSSVLYGSDAVAGVVNLITRRARRPLGAELRASYGSMQRLELDATGEAKGEDWGLRLSGGLARRDAYLLDPTSIGTTGSSLDGIDASAGGDLRVSEGTALQANATYARRVQRGVDVGVTGATFDRASRDDSLSVRLSPRWTLSRNASLRVDGAYAWFNRRYLRDQRRSNALDTIEDTREQQGRLGAQLDAKVGDAHAFVAGAELLGEWLRADRLGEDGTGQRARASLYVQDNWALAPRWKLTLVPGARVDTDTQFGTAVTPRLAARMDPTSWLTLRGSYGWAFRAPGFQELLLDFENPSVGYRVHGNPDLRPERSRSFNLSVEVKPAASSLLWVSAFQHNLRDMIGVSTELVGPQQLFTYVNIARARVRGGELGVRQQLPGRVSAELGYTLTDGRSEETGLALEGQARHRLTAQATWRHRTSGLEAWVRGALVGPRPFYPDTDGDGVANPYDAKTYVTVDARLGWRLREELQLFVLGTNLANAGNPTDLPIPPRAVQAGFSARL